MSVLSKFPWYTIFSAGICRLHYVALKPALYIEVTGYEIDEAYYGAGV